jgi:hypothetical protein
MLAVYGGNMMQADGLSTRDNNGSVGDPLAELGF